MTQDRGTSFFLDRIEVDESGFIATAASAAAIFQREHVIPEVDAYRYSSLYKLAKAKGNSHEYEAVHSTILSELHKDVTAVRDSGAGAADLVITMPYPVADTLSSSEAVTRYINVGQFSQGGINIDVQTFNGIPIIRVPSERIEWRDGVRRMERRYNSIQKFIDNTVVRHMNPYVPMKNGILAKSVIIGSRMGSGELVFVAPYSHKLFYSENMRFSKSRHRLAQARWVEGMKAARMPQIEREVRDYSRRLMP